MKYLQILATAAFSFALFSCGGDNKSESIPTASSGASAATESAAPAASNPSTYDPKRGLGPHENVDAVSYTHLDVYKRQNFTKLSVMFTIPFFGKNAPILYSKCGMMFIVAGVS